MIVCIFKLWGNWRQTNQRQKVICSSCVCLPLILILEACAKKKETSKKEYTKVKKRKKPNLRT
jgi:hypothetical protein